MSHIYLDLDGTLTDPYEGISKSILYALEQLGVAPPGEDVLRECIGPPLLASFASLVGESRADEALQHYRGRFADIGWRENSPYAGIHDALGALVQSNFRLFVATSKPTVFADRIVSHFGLAEYISTVHGSGLDGARTNKAELLEHAISENRSTEAVMIGDRKHDAIGAAHNSIPFIGVLYGYGSREELTAAGATMLAATPVELPGLVHQALSR